MLSKNNYQERLRKMDDKQQRFSIRKFSVGAASVLVGTAILSMQSAQTVHADAVTDKDTTDVTTKNSDQNNQETYNKVVSEDQNNAVKSSNTNMESQDSKVASFSVPKNEGTFVEAPVTATWSAGTTEDKADNQTAETKSSNTANTNEEVKTETVKDNNTEKQTNIASAQENNKLAETKVADTQAKTNTAQATTDNKNAVKTTEDDATIQTASVNTATLNTTNASNATLFSASALSESKLQAVTPRASSATNDTQAKNNNYKLVTNANALQQAINSGVAGVNIDRSIDASNVDLAINNTFAIVGINDAAALNLGQKSLNNSGNLTLQDITINGSISGNGTVNIKGNVTSNVNSINSSVPTQDQYNAQNYTGNRNNFKNSNIAGRSVNLEKGASLTVNSTEINDGINLTDGGTVNVGDNATLNVNLTNASTTATRYHTAGVFAKNSGNFITGYKSNVNFNTGLGQAIAMGATRPTTTDADTFGGYGARSRNDGPTLVRLGDSSTFNFTGRDGIILGNNANFISGENSNVHFENKGRGVALDFAANSNIEISKHSNTYFHSVGKTGNSGSFSGYNYIGVNEGGNITIDEYATFRVILEGRNNNNYDDVITLDSQNANTNAAFTSKTGAIVDIRDDNTNFYAELISFPLGSSNTRIDIHDPLMLNLQRYSSGGPTTGWMPIGGDMINTTSNQYTANLIYMSSNKGVFSVDGTDYVVYQKIKSDGSKQIWLNVNGVNIPMNGFQTKDIWNNQANPDVSIKGNDLTSGIKANQVHNYDGTPLTGKDAPYYGISTQRASHQIWFPHRTQMEVVGSHNNTIKYVDEDGNQLFEDKTQNLNLTRRLTLDITDDKIEEIQQYALSHNADETLEYIKNAQGVSEDSGWIYTDDQGNVVTNPYAEVVSPVKDGYTASIESSNVPGITEGANGTSVTAKLQYKEELVQNGELSNNYKQNGISAILPDNYETVVVYKKAKEVKDTLKFYDDTTKSYITDIADQTATGKENDDVNFKDGASTVKSLEDQGYKFVNVTNGTPDDSNATVLDGSSFSDVDFGKFGKDGKTFVVHLIHNQIPVGPDSPDKHGVDPDQIKQIYTSTLHYKDNAGNTLSSDQQQTSTWTRTVTVDEVTNEVISGGQYDTNWTLNDTDNKYNDFTVPVIKGYVARKTTNNGVAVSAVVAGQNKVQQNLEDTVVYDKVGKIVPVDPSGNPIPDAPTPIYPNDPTDPTKVKPDQPVPNVPGYMPVDPTPITPEDPTKDTPVPYTKDPVKAGFTVQYIDQDDDNSVIKSDEVNGNIGDKINYTTNDSISDLVNKGYILVTDGFTGQAGDDFTADNNGQVYKVVFKHGTRPVTPDNPADPNKPVDPDHPNTPTPSNPNLSKTDLQKTITRTVEYKYADGTQAHEPVKQELTFTGEGTIDLVTGNLVTVDKDGNVTSQNGKITWNHDSQDFNAIPAIDHTGYYISGINQNNSTANVDGQTGAVGAETVTPNSQNGNIVITLTKNPDVPVAAQGSITYIDDTTGQTIESANFAGSVGQKINYTTADSIKNWEAKGYNLVSNNFKDGEEVFTDGKNAFEVHLVHATTPVTPENPGKPGEPVNPSDPDDPHTYPDNYVPEELTKTVTRDVTYVYADGSQAEAPVHQEVKFTGNGYLDLVTGEYVTVDNNGKITGKGQINWTPENANFDATKSIDTSKYQIIGIKENNTTANVDQTTGVVAGETVTQNSNNSSVVITLANKPAPAKDQRAKVQYIDLDDNNKVMSESGELTGKAGERISYSTADEIAKYLSQNYVLAEDGFSNNPIFDNDDDNEQVFKVTFHHKQVPVNPDTPDKHGVDPSEVEKSVKERVHYEGAGDKTPADNVQTSKWTRTVTVDAVTGKVIENGQYTTDWSIAKGEKTVYDQVNTPVVDGYHADKREVPATAVTQDDIDVVVTYKPNGKIIPTDPSGNPIPDVPTPTYPTDPKDPTKVVPDEPVPEIPGMIPSTPTVTPEEPGKDTPVPYNPVIPAKDQAAVVNYIDADDNNAIITSSGNLTGKAGDKIDYSTKSTITDLINKGYVLVNDGFPVDASFDNDDNTTQIFTVILKHGTVPVTPDQPGKPGEPINPNDPDGPKWPEGTDENSVKRTGTQTIHYEGAGDKTPSDDVQTFDFTKKMLVDKVTGKILDSGEWNVTSHTFGYKDTPVIDGYHADKRNAGGTVVTPDDLDKKVVVSYKPNGKIIPTDPSGNPIPDVPTPTYPTDPKDPTKVVPDEPVPDIPGMIPSTPTVTPEEPGKDTPVPYNPIIPAKDQIAQVIYRDVQNGANKQIATSGNLTGKNGSEINYSTADKIKELISQGYVLKNDGFPAGAVFDNDDSKDQVFYVDFIHGQAPVNPDNPHEGIDPSQYEKTVKERVHYEGAGDKTPVDNVQTSKWTRTLTIDTVTGNVVENGQYTTDWSIAKGEKTVYDQVNTPVVDGYHADKREVPATAVTPEDIDVVVTYKPNGKIIPTDPSGNPIPNVPTPTYPTDPKDPTKVVPDEPVPDIPGMIPSTPTVTPEEPGKDTPVPYNPVIPAKDQAAIVSYIDADNGNAEITNSGNLTGKAGDKIDYSTKSTIADLENKGYVLVNDGFPVDASFDNDDNTTQRFVVVLKHGTVPVTPDQPGKPGEPINPNDPDGPKWPEGTDENSVKRTGTQTIHYEGAGDKTPSDDVQTFDFTKKMLVDKVTGKIIDSGEWNVTSHTFGYKDTPVIDGYHADKRNAGGTVVTPDDLNKIVTVNYSQNGKIIPTDPSGNPIPDVPTPTYPTDPKDPTKVVPDEPVPDIPGMIPSTPTVTPEDPGKDTPVPYNPVVPAKDQAAIVSYVDADNGNAEITNSGNLTGKAGDKIDYSTKSTIADLENKGYVLVNDGFPVDASFDNDDNTTQRFVVVLKHGTVPVTPDQPGKPGEPINPNDPDGPKWPEGTDENSVKRTGTQTIHYEGAGDKTPSDDVQTFDFTKKMVVDKVTGKIIDSGEWNVTSHTFGYKDTPVIDGYHADKRNAGGSVVTPDDLNKTVTVNYSQNGKIIPTDPSGNPIPNVPTPTYPTDPKDPTKVVPDEPVPEIPGMIPSTPTVTPEEPGKDTPVPYNPVKDPDKVTTVEGKQIVHFVDGDNGNNPLRDPNTQTHEFKITNGVPDESSHTFTLVDVPVIPGYIAEVKSAGGKTVTPDTPLAEVTVVYHKIGKIVPVDPNGNPIPNAPTPSYTNDPTDPTKVVPNEPVPAITGKTPDKTSVTPTDPTKDTPVVYKDNEVPATPTPQKAVVNFVDVNTGKIIKTSGILSGRPGEDINKLYSSSEIIKQLEDAGYEVVYNAFDGDGVTKYFDDDDNTTQQFTVALKLKEKAKTPDPIVPDPETPAKDPETPAEKVTRPEQPVKQTVNVPTPQKPVEKKTADKKEVLPQTGADNNEAATILGAAAAAIGMTSLIGAKRRKKDDK